MTNSIPYFLPQVQRTSFMAPPSRNAFLFAQPPGSESAAPADSFQASEAAQLAGLRTGPQNLMLFGGDRKQAIESLIASGAKPENPKLGFFKNILRKFAGGKTKTVTKPISANQSITSKVKVKNFQVKDLRLTTQAKKEGNNETLRHIDFNPITPTGKKAQVKDVGTVIGKGTVRREFEQEIEHPHQGEPGRIKNSYYDPKTGKKFLQTSEVASNIEKDKFGTVKSHKDRNTYRQIDLLDSQGKADKRYIFDYGAKSIRLEDLDASGQITSTQKLSSKTDYFKLVDQLSNQPPSAAGV
ncbi:MAG: hypothetical protein U0931_08295 [Vulcanimicrobiota bacterium]